MVLQDRITLFPPADAQTNREDRLLVFFITGNPGLIEYYRTFLTALQAQLLAPQQQQQNNITSSPPHRNVVIHGVSLLGFELAEHDADRPKDAPPYDLRETIDGVKRALLRAVSEYGAPLATTAVTAGGRRHGAPLRVVLVGHSVGAYVLLEVVEWWRKVQAGEAGPKKGVNGAVGASSAMTIVGGVGLFPTVVDIVMSPRGRLLAPLLRIPFLSVVVSALVRLLLLFVPTFLVTLLLSIVLMERPAAAVTAAWLKSRHGVRQTVFLGSHEMIEIAEDRWSPDVWGSQALDTGAEDPFWIDNKDDRTRLYFLWGDNDHWVDNARRDRLIARRASTLMRADATLPRMEVDSTGISHAFCVHAKTSETVAEKVAGYIKDML